ncbi:MAG: HAD-IIIC family phosphatase [Nitrospirae bacterium]|nr:HAD-IIIC family phosphatase [Magnetococcales bacterium]
MNELQLYDAIARVLNDHDERIVIHSSLIHFRLPWKQLKWPLMGAFRRLIQQGRTLIIPSFTLSFCRGQPYHYLHSPSETGIVADWFMELYESRRSAHPIYSFVIAGPDRDRLLRQKGKTTWDPESLFGLFQKENVRFVMFGVGLDACTQIHYYEEEAQVPYRYYKPFQGLANFGSGQHETIAMMYARHIDSVGRVQFGMVGERLLAKGLVDGHPWQGGSIQAYDCESLALVTRELIESDPYVFMGSDRIKARYAVERKKQRQQSKPIKIALLGTHNLEFLKSALMAAMERGIQNQETVVTIPPVGQLYQEIINPASALAHFKPDFSFFTDRLEDVFKVHALVPGLDANMEVVTLYLQMIRQFATGHTGVIYVHEFISVTIPPEDGADGMNPHGIRALVEKANHLLHETLETVEHVFPFNLQQVISAFHGPEIFDPRLWFLGRFPYSQSFSISLAERYLGMVLAMTGRTTRMLILDLDNTLWGGVLGEDGPEGIQLGGDYPGNAFLHFQKTIIQLMQRGIALAVASKNDESHALATMNSLKNMVIRQEHLATWRIDWNEKWSNVAEMAAEVGLGLEHLLFVDDNPVERERMRMNLPEVKIVDLPEDPARYAATLLAQPWLACVQLTGEDRARAGRYASKKKMELERRHFTNHEEFYATLEPKLHVVPLQSDNMARAVQLIHKTNQFNTTAQRFTQGELEWMRQQNREVLVLGLEDRFSEFEHIGLALVHWGRPAVDCLTIDLFLLSCRVLGRGVESGFLAWLANRASEKKFKRIYGLIVHAPRNTPVRDVYQKHHFSRIDDSETWELILGPSNPKMPAWMTLIDKTGTPPHE